MLCEKEPFRYDNLSRNVIPLQIVLAIGEAMIPLL